MTKLWRFVLTSQHYTVLPVISEQNLKQKHIFMECFTLYVSYLIRYEITACVQEGLDNARHSGLRPLLCCLTWL